jgi:hypothetical protein
MADEKYLQEDNDTDELCFGAFFSQEVMVFMCMPCEFEQQLNLELPFFGVIHFHQCVVGVMESCCAMSPDSNAATQNGNGRMQSYAAGAHLSTKRPQERGVSIVSILKETSPQFCVPAPVPEEGLGQLGVLSQSMCL